MSGSPGTIHERGLAALLEGRERLDVPPTSGDDRWGLSLVVRPDPAGADVLDALTGTALGLAGPGQWPTGARDSSHLTVTYLERVHREIGPEDAEVRRFTDVVGQVAATTRPLRFALTGLALAERGVLALAQPVDDAPDGFRAAVLGALGELGEAESRYRASSWWSTLLHFAAPVADRAALAAWVDARTTTPFGTLTAEGVEAVRYEYDGRKVVPVPLSVAALTGVPEEALDGA